MPQYQKWCDAMSATAATRVVLSNLAFDLAKNPPSHEAIGAVLRDVAREWEETHRHATPTAADARDAAMLLESKLDRGVGVTFCTGTAVTTTALLSRITDEKALWDFLLHSSPFGEPADRDTSIFSPQDLIRLDRDHIKSDAKLTGRRPLAWVTTRSVIEAFIDDLDEDKVATRVRNFLGLDHYDQRHRLVEILYPDDAARDLELHAPTIIEGACKKVYRSYAGETDPWGRAVDLETKAKIGAPEAVHPPIGFTAEFRLRFLGPVTPGPLSFTDDDLDANCPHPWRPDDVDAVRRCCEAARP